ncbi:MAG: PxKF domain-containing protein [Woeseiaceae bacterium]|jgi:hypothetical protein|nr:PxKF domain-containing protein [Woeseiaceae bacterium]
MKSGSRWFRGALPRLAFLLLACLAGSQSTLAQTDLFPGDPGPNVNVVGPTVVEDSWDIRDVGLKQQNEPACGIRPGNPACVLCAYNDNRTVDVPAIGDGWISMSTSCDFGRNWTSRPVPGHNAHPAPVGESFAADPRLVVLPGMAILGFIAGDRDSDRGIAAIQFWPEINREDADHYEPGLNTITVETGSEGKFVDKPELFAVLDPPEQQQPVTISVEMEDPDLGTITRTLPSGKLYMAWAEFTGSGGSKLWYKVSTDWGQTWKNQAVKLSEEQNLVSGITMTGMGQDVLAVWRRVGDNNNPDDFVGSIIFQDGKKSTKGEPIGTVCSFDQVSANTGFAVTFRTNDFPWLANDGNNYYLFYSDRAFGGDCASGRPRIVFQQSTDGLSWSAPTPVDNSPAATVFDNGEQPAGDGFQFMPVAFGANGEVRVSWYDTRRETLPPATEEVAFIADTTDGLSAVFRQLDVYTARLKAAGPGVAATVSEPIRVSQFPIAAEIESADEGSGAVDSYTAIEAEANFPNLRMYASGTLPFIGDYIATAAQEFRLFEGAVAGDWQPWVPNASADPGSPLTDYIVAWGDNRGVRGSIFNPDFNQPTPFSPNDSATSTAKVTLPTEMLEDAKERTLRAEGIVAGDDSPIACTPGAPQDRTRDANIIASLVKDRLKVYATTPSKPLTNLLRAFVLGISNDNPPVRDPADPTFVDPGRTLRLFIADQPCPAPEICRASFAQQPSVPPFPGPVPFEAGQSFIDLTVPPESTLARTVFVVADADSARVPINVYDSGEGSCVAGNPADFFDVCTPIASISIGGSGPAGTLENPNYDSPLCADVSDTECTDDVLKTELHNPQLINPQLINDPTQNPQLINLTLENPQLINPQLINPQLINPQLINFGYENPQLINPQLINPQLINNSFENPQLINPQLINPQLINPQLINSSLSDGSGSTTTDANWVDFTYAIQNTGNVTTAFNADLTLAGEGLENTDSQFIAWTIYASPTADDCQYVGQADVQVLSQVNAPDNELDVATIFEPFAGEISAIAAPGQILYWTRRVFGDIEDLQTLTVEAFTASSQAANCNDIESGDYFCEASLETDRERILLDTLPPVINAEDGDFLPNVEATGPGGGCLVFEGDSLVTAEDNGTIVYPTCVVAETGAEVCVAGGAAVQDPIPVPLTQPGSPLAVTCSISDDAGNEASVTLNLNVFDTTPPTFDPPLNPPPYVINAVADIPDADGLVRTAEVVYPEFTATDNPLVDPDVVVTCSPPSTVTNPTEFPIGTTTVICDAIDDGPNPDSTLPNFGNITTTSFDVVVADQTPPTGSAPTFTDDELQANATAGRDNFTYPLPAFIDNDPRPDSSVSVTCSPASGFFLPLNLPTTITCTGTDASGNEGLLSFDVAAIDTLGPIVTPPADQPVIVAVDGDGFARANLESYVTVADQFDVDPDPTVSCETSGGAVSGDPLPIGTYSVSCTAQDASGNLSESPAIYALSVGYGNSFGIFFNKNTIKAGSSVPFTFGWLGSDGGRIDSSGADPVVSAVDCATQSTVVLAPGQFPGNSDLRWDASQLEWKFNWQTVDMAGDAIPPDSYCVRVTSQTTGQTVPDSGFTRIRVTK